MRFTAAGDSLIQQRIPETYEGIGHVVLGYSDMEEPEPLPRKEDYIHYVD